MIIIIIIILVCLRPPQKAFLHRWPNPNLTLTFKRRVRPPRPQLVAFPLLGLPSKVAVGSGPPHRTVEAALLLHSAAAARSLSLPSPRWPRFSPGTPPIPCPSASRAGRPRGLQLVAVRIYLLCLFGPLCLFFSVPNHSLTPPAQMPTFIVNFLTTSETFPFCQTQTNLAVPFRYECELPRRTKKTSSNNFMFPLYLFLKVTFYGPFGFIRIPSLIMTFLACPKSTLETHTCISAKS